MAGNISDERIPNNVDLSSDRRLQRALCDWQPSFVDWWKDMGPEGFQTSDIYLRTAVSVHASGWAHYDYVRMPEYRWGIFLQPQDEQRTIGFGDHQGEPVWQTVPGEYRNILRRIIVTQADTEPASVEQQRLLGKTAPSLYDLRNLFQVNVEEGRHLWAMVYLLHSYFGRDGREEAEELLDRRSGDKDHPRILQAFNYPITDWLHFFCFTMFTDRDGKYQLGALAESAFDPLARTTRFMLTEEAHHLFVGDTGVDRVIQRTAELMREHGDDGVRAAGGIPLDIIQRYIFLWVSLSIDLFGGEVSSNAADYFATGLKGRWKEDRYEEHTCLGESLPIERVVEGRVVTEDVPLRNAMNEVLRQAYLDDCAKAMTRWNRTLEQAGLSDRLRLPDRKFHRHIGLYAEHHFDPEGRLIDEATWEARRGEWLPSPEDEAWVRSLMQPVYEPGKVAGWIAPPRKGINGQPLEMEYVRFA
ncbi:MAG: benzoyl-CoA 2,3-epoxidase subunit BoxB [Deltaproteobacteria bacterium]|nr:benzoyl-CoA 2,3-epoxidase subunit BoxB [Deltaproteobacteria bacterium]MCB9785736.1 benzoyl-CoA 2,3-epoxidase subunit BoxB [Deltaproteobacteria bacterium]